MRVQLLSDLHFECDRDGGEAFAASVPVLGDVLVLAGDIVPLRSAEELTRVLGWWCGRFPQVVYVPGNHEYYKTRPSEADALLADCARPFSNLHVLNGAMVTLGGVQFLGATLWFPSTPEEPYYRRLVGDFVAIEHFVPWVHETHGAQLAFLRGHLRPGAVVVTHHLPHPRSVSDVYRGSPLNRFFLADDAAELVETGGAAFWLHGHTHTACDYRVGATRVVCNPRGYPGELRVVASHRGDEYGDQHDDDTLRRPAGRPIDVGLVLEL